jgi:hypothetical protein
MSSDLKFPIITGAWVSLDDCAPAGWSDERKQLETHEIQNKLRLEYENSNTFTIETMSIAYFIVELQMNVNSHRKGSFLDWMVDITRKNRKFYLDAIIVLQSEECRYTILDIFRQIFDEEDLLYYGY